jgi:hypothetical protein
MTSEACGQLPLPLPGERVWRVAERDERLAGQHHEQSNETPLRGRAGRVHAGRGVPPSAVRHSKSLVRYLRHGPSLAHAQTPLYNRFTLRNRS